jgi:signal transduction histidine kinase
MKRAQVELANQTQLLEAFFENSMTCNVILDREFNYIRVNSAYARSDNRRVEDFPGRNHFELYPSDAKALFEEVVAGKQPLEVEARSFAYPDDPARSRTYWDWSLVPTLNGAGEVDRLLFILRDVTEQIKAKGEREHLQAQLFQAQKMEAVGQLAGGVAHDFNNILTAIIGFSTLMEMKMAADDPQRTSVNQILAAADRAAELTRSLLAFSRKQIINPQPADLNQIVQQTGRFLQRIIGEDIELRMTFNEEHLPVNVDSVQIEQVLMNLATNARDVMPDGGVLFIGTELVEIGENFIRAHGFGTPGEYALITVTDTGSGMDEEVRKRIFEPFFTTKEVGRGTGLGLSIVYGIIKQHNGFINVYSEPGQGTTFTIYLRLHRAESELKPGAVQTVPVEGTETILVADDDAMLRNIAEEVFRSYGYTVITAEDGQDAVEKFIQNRERIAMVVLDVIMPKMNGKDAYEQIRKLSPGCKVIFMSGYTDDIIHKRGLLDVGLAFVSKPLRPEKLLQKVREVLDMANGGQEQVAEGNEP